MFRAAAQMTLKAFSYIEPVGNLFLNAQIFEHFYALHVSLSRYCLFERAYNSDMECRKLQKVSAL
jgi:hypothetical protein